MIEQVPVADILASLVLIEEYAAECSIPAIGNINTQPRIYDAMEKSGVLKGFKAIDAAGNDIGFAIVLTPILPHYGQKVATLESIFITAASRRSGAGLDLMRAVERYAQEVGCVGILYSAPVGGTLERLLEASKEYQRTNAVFYRRLV
jgi:GNAT superfamily N-acetyltransferase